MSVLRLLPMAARHLQAAAYLCFSAMLLAACQSTAHDRQGVGAFTFDAWEGVPLKVHYAEPEGVSEAAPAIFVMHGTKRNAGEYRDNWIELATRHGFRVYAPEFDRRRFEGSAGYNLGGAGKPGARAFDAIEPLYQHLTDRRGAPDTGYIIFGHSAGAQFVHRFVCFTETLHLRLAIAANSGWYTLPEGPHAWPYSLEGAPDAACDLDAYFSAPLLIALGDRDNDPAYYNLRRTPEALDQGPHRLARGLNFLATAHRLADARGLPLRWRLEIVEGVGHDNAGMAEAAARLIGRLAGTSENWEERRDDS